MFPVLCFASSPSFFQLSLICFHLSPTFYNSHTSYIYYYLILPLPLALIPFGFQLMSFHIDEISSFLHCLYIHTNVHFAAVIFTLSSAYRTSIISQFNNFGIYLLQVLLGLNKTPPFLLLLYTFILVFSVILFLFM